MDDQEECSEHLIDVIMHESMRGTYFTMHGVRFSQIGDLNLIGANIDSFRSAIWFRSAILIPNTLTLPDLNL